jgi:acyl-CoA synthetase (AMP-forming)/AMP-acid ligase II
VPITIGVFPMFHAYGLHAYIFWASLRPTTYIILEKWNTEHFLRTIVKYVSSSLSLIIIMHSSSASSSALMLMCAPTRYRATDLGLIPSAIHQLVNHPAIKSADLSSVISITSGAAYLPPELEAQMTRFLNEGMGIHQGAISRVPVVLYLHRARR